MSIQEKMAEDLKNAMRSKDTLRLSVLRMLKSRLMEKQVAMRGEKGKDYVLTDEEVTVVISAYAKQRRDSIEQYEQGGREELAEKERAELAMLSDYLPEQLDETKLREIVARAIADSGASGPADLGKVMKLVMPQVKGRADGKQVNAIAKELVTGG